MNVIKKLHEQTNLPYKIMLADINEILEEKQETDRLAERTLIHYANGDFCPKRKPIIKALAEYFEMTPTALIDNLKTNKESA